MAQTKSMNGVSMGNAYASSFGNIPSGTCYQKVDTKSLATGQPKYEVDMREKLNQAVKLGMKALNTQTGGAGTAGYANVPIYVDPNVVDTTRKYTPLVEIIPRVTNQGTSADYNIITAKGGGFSAAEDATLNETNTTTDRASTAIKYLYAVGRVTGQAIASYPSYVLQGLNPQGGAVGGFNDGNAFNAKQFEILVKTREIRELEESLIVNGNSGVTATEFDGIVTLMGATNTVDKNITALALDDIDTAIKNAFDDGGRPSIAVASSGVYTDLLGLLNAKIGYLQSTQQVFWGFSAIVLNTMVGQVTVIPSMYLSNTTGSKAIYFLDMSVVEMRVLQDLTYEELAKTNDSEKFMLKIYEALIIRNTSFCSSITEIA
jgi:hypothetical protein